MMQQVQTFFTLTVAIVFGYWSFGRQLSLNDVYILVGCSLISGISCWILRTSVLQFLVNGFLVSLVFSPLFIMDWSVWYQLWPWPVFFALFATILLSSLQLARPQVKTAKAGDQKQKKK